MEIKALFSDGSMASCASTPLYSENGSQGGAAFDRLDIDLSDPEARGIRAHRRMVSFGGEALAFPGGNVITLFSSDEVASMLWVSVDGTLVLKRVASGSGPDGPLCDGGTLLNLTLPEAP